MRRVQCAAQRIFQFGLPHVVLMAATSRLSCADLIRASINKHALDDGLPGHRRAEATPSFGRLCPAMTNIVYRMTLAILIPVHRVRQPQRQRRHIGDDHQHDQ